MMTFFIINLFDCLNNKELIEFVKIYHLKVLEIFLQSFRFFGSEQDGGFWWMGCTSLLQRCTHPRYGSVGGANCLSLES